MKKTRRTLIFLLGGMICVSLGMSVPSMSFGELLSPAPVETNTTMTESLSKETKKGVVSFPSVSGGLRSAESEVEQTSDRLLPLQRTLSTEDQELVETTDASGGTMINLQGRFQCGLKVPDESMDTPVEEPFSPAAP